jgi:formylmethanofuran dehydrogenase subunit E
MKLLTMITLVLILTTVLFAELELPNIHSAIVLDEKVISNTSHILIYDEDDLLEIMIEDVGKYHGDVCLCLTLAFRSIQFAISQLWQDEIPKRGDFKIISACPTPGSKDCFEFITRVITRGKGNNFKLEIPTGTNIENMTNNNFTFLFIQKSTGDSIRIKTKEGLFPDGFFELRKIVKYGNISTEEEEENFWKFKGELKHKFLNLEVKEIFVFER